MVPHEQIRWLVDQKDNVLSHNEVRRKHTAFESLVPTVVDPLNDVFMFDVVRRDLSRNLNILQPIMREELNKAIELSMGLGTDRWHEICLFETMRSIIRPCAHRVLYGLPLCEDRDFVKSMENFSSWLGSSAFITGQLVPGLLRPFAGSLAAIPISFYLKQVLRKLLPTVKKRRDEIQRGEKHDQNNFISWYTAILMNADVDASKKTPEGIANRLALLVSKAKPYGSNICPNIDI